MPGNLFKSITFDCGKEFSNWQSMSNRNDLSIYFADPGTPSQRGLNEHSNGLLRMEGLAKDMDLIGSVRLLSHPSLQEETTSQ
ncbi:hypothetical protein GCM10022378_21980 [Salinicoccus jeotgali]|uniref:Integrase catalytic domain-containing protein n=1 Tax=Salinicoccus jeotgali TaxID=381634 RepID=A0ABP7FA49_9STAP